MFQCGQCIMVCPTAALSERINFSELQVFFHDKNKKMVAAYSPAVAVTLAEEFGIKAGRDLNGILNAILRKIGFDYVFDNSIGADISVMEESNELMSRIKNGGSLPMFSSCCPSWVKFAEQSGKTKILENLVTTKSSQQMMGAILKSYYAEKIIAFKHPIYLWFLLFHAHRGKWKLRAQR